MNNLTIFPLFSRLKRGRMYISALASRYYDDPENEMELVDFDDYLKKVSMGPTNMEFRYKSNHYCYGFE